MVIRELINAMGLEVDEASFQKAEDAVQALEQVLAGVSAGALAAVSGIGQLVEKMAPVAKEADELTRFSGVLKDWTDSAAKATERLGDVKEEVREAARATQEAEKAMAEHAATTGTAVKKAREWIEVLADMRNALAFVQEMAQAAMAPVTELVERSKEINLHAMMLGVSKGALQEWQYAISAVGGEADELGESLLDLSDKMSDAKSGEGEQYELFKELGVQVKDTHTGKLKPLEAFLPELANAFRKVTNDTERAGLASRLLGETGAKTLLPMLMQGSDGMARLSAEARSMGAVLSDEAIQKAIEFREEWGRLGAILQAVKFELGGALLPGIRDLVQTFREWVTENRELVSAGLDVGMRLFSAAVRIAWQFTEPLVRLLKVLVADAGLGRAALYALAFALLVYSGQAIMGAVGSTWSLTRALLAQVPALQRTIMFMQLAGVAGWRMAAAQWAAAVWAAAAPYLIAAAWAAVVLLLLAMFEDVYTFFQGGESIIGRWGEWILKALSINPSDSGLVKFLKWMGMLLFDWQQAWRLAGEAIASVMDTLEAKAKALMARMLAPFQGLLGFFQTGPGKLLLNLLTGGVSGAISGASALMDGAVDLVKQMDPEALGLGFRPQGAGQYLGKSAYNGPLLMSAAAASTNTSQSVVNAPSQVVNQTIMVPPGAPPADFVSAGRKGAEEGWEQQLRNSQFGVVGG